MNAHGVPCGVAVAVAVAALGPARASGQCSSAWSLAATTGPTARAYAGVAYDSAAGRVLLYGGGTGSSFRRDLWQWNGTAWTLLNAGTTGGPGLREAVAIAFDDARQRLVVFGGAGTLTGDTWEWTGSAWSQVATAGPPARGFTAMAYDAARSNCVMFGGWTNGFNYFSDTWTWNGASWSAAPAGATPHARAFHAIAYDPTRQRTVLFGGLWNDATPSSNYMGDTWEWDGAAWTEMFPPTAPGSRAYHAMSYDPGVQRVVLYGGFNINSGAFNDTWTWDGATWTLASTTVPGPLRQAHAMTFDPANGELMLFGGVTGGTYRSDTWTGMVTDCGTPCDPDVNCDGSANGFDIEAAEQAVNGDFTNFCQPDADYNRDGSVNGFDVEAVEQGVNGAPCP